MRAYARMPVPGDILQSAAYTIKLELWNLVYNSEAGV